MSAKCFFFVCSFFKTGTVCLDFTNPVHVASVALNAINNEGVFLLLLFSTVWHAALAITDISRPISAVFYKHWIKSANIIRLIRQPLELNCV